MPNRQIHIAVGAPAGLAFAALRAANLSEPEVIAESIGGAIGGVLGALMPDLIDIPLSPNHRAFGHGVVPATGLGGTALLRLDQWQSGLRAQAQHYARLGSAASSPIAQLGWGLAEFFFRLLAGVLAGFLGGYASHLVLDLATPRSLPVFG